MTENKFSWIHAFTDADIPATTRLVLHTICMFMNSRGEGAFPAIETIAEKSGLGITAVKKHIAIAVDAGWLKKGKHGFGGQGWSRNEYHVSYPEKSEEEQNGNTPENAGREAADLSKKVGHLSQEGGSPDVKKAGREVSTNIPVNNHITDSTPKSPNEILEDKNQIEREFEQVWNIYTNKQDRRQALSAYQMARIKVSFEWIMAGVRHYVGNCVSNRQSAKLLKNWFGGECWHDVPKPDDTQPNAIATASGEAAQLSPEIQKRWADSLEALAMTHGTGVVRAYFTNVELCEGRGGDLQLFHTNKFTISRIKENYFDYLENYYKSVGGGKITLMHVEEFNQLQAEGGAE